MPKQPGYTDDQRAVALSFLRASLPGGDLTNATDAKIKKAAKTAAVAAQALSIWVAEEGGKQLPPPRLAPEPEPEEPRQAAPSVLGRPDVPEIFQDAGPVADDIPPPVLFAPAHDVAQWMRETFITPGAPLHNPDHWHLGAATIAVLFTNVPNGKNGKMVVGMAELVGGSRGDKWQTGRDHFQMFRWFGALPDFLITLSATYCHGLDDASFCALCEHELYHCSLKADEHGIPKETPDGDFIWSMRGHDVEQFTGVVARYGVRAAGQDVEAMVAAANKQPIFSVEAVANACCGSCR